MMISRSGCIGKSVPVKVVPGQVPLMLVAAVAITDHVIEQEHRGVKASGASPKDADH